MSKKANSEYIYKKDLMLEEEEGKTTPELSLPM